MRVAGTAIKGRPRPSLKQCTSNRIDRHLEREQHDNTQLPPPVVDADERTSKAKLFVPIRRCTCTWWLSLPGEREREVKRRIGIVGVLTWSLCVRHGRFHVRRRHHAVVVRDPCLVWSMAAAPRNRDLERAMRQRNPAGRPRAGLME